MQKTESLSSIEDWRKEIDQIDEQLVRLLNERSKCAIELGRIKRELDLPIYSPGRESEVIAHVTGVNPGPLDADAVRRLFERIIDESRSIERAIVEREAGVETDGTEIQTAIEKMESD
jgi:chorismate mutase